MARATACRACAPTACDSLRRPRAWPRRRRRLQEHVRERVFEVEHDAPERGRQVHELAVDGEQLLQIGAGVVELRLVDLDPQLTRRHRDTSAGRNGSSAGPGTLGRLRRVAAGARPPRRTQLSSVSNLALVYGDGHGYEMDTGDSATAATALGFGPRTRAPDRAPAVTLSQGSSCRRRGDRLVAFGPSAIPQPRPVAALRRSRPASRPGQGSVGAHPPIANASAA